MVNNAMLPFFRVGFEPLDVTYSTPGMYILDIGRANQITVIITPSTNGVYGAPGTHPGYPTNSELEALLTGDQVWFGSSYTDQFLLYSGPISGGDSSIAIGNNVLVSTMSGEDATTSYHSVSPQSSITVVVGDMGIGRRSRYRTTRGREYRAGFVNGTPTIASAHSISRNGQYGVAGSDGMSGSIRIVTARV